MLDGYLKEIRKKIGNDLIFLPCAGLIIVNDKNEILMQLREDNNKWGLVGGAIEPGETPMEAAVRECYEEMGILPNGLRLFDVFSGENFYFTYPNGDRAIFLVTVYISKYMNEKMTLNMDEVLDAEFFNVDNLPNNLNKPDKHILDAYKKRY